MCKQLNHIGNYIYSQKVRISTLFTLCLHIFDIVSDIIVADDLYREGSEYFQVCLGIMIFSFTSCALLSLDHPWFAIIITPETQREKFRFRDCISFLIKFVLWLIIDILQLLYIMISLLKICIIPNDESEFNFVDVNIVQKRINESLLESGPESLFQLFIILHQSATKGFYQLSTYYLSVLLSLSSLSNTLVSFENNYPNSTREKCIHDKTIKYTSKYMLTIILYRFTEVFSRIGMLACIGEIYDGYALFVLIGIDYICINVLNIIKRLVRKIVENCNQSILALEEYDDKYKINKIKQTRLKNKVRTHLLMNSAFKIQLAWRQKNGNAHIYIRKRIQYYTIFDYRFNKCWEYDSEIEKLIENNLKCEHPIDMETYKKLFSVRYFKRSLDLKKKAYGDKLEKEKYESELKEINNLMEHDNNLIKRFPLQLEIYGMIANAIFNLKYMGVYYKSFLQSEERENHLSGMIDRYKERGIDINFPSKKYWWNRYSMFFISRYISHCVISVLLIYKLSIHSYSTTILFISISSIVCYFINMLSYYYIKLWNKNKSKYRLVYTKPLIDIKCKCKKLKDISDNTVNV